eukprot:CAMPEP_0115143496 /NCGR_PEP_ID=MMETSP0227-20121206/60814_1 /TAXON_ID=89957 /ORGANISM="Polarella glacialis, Strain CCMP 1383" /LENGTH=450 /DNA_ID=CAMNT_0002552353 /DNA_START=117 /DNA_END=1469 /DNA_ORIENTATION=+
MGKPRKVSEDEIQRRWHALPADQRQAAMSFDDPVLVDRIKASLQALFEKQMVMNVTMSSLGIPLSGSSDPFASSVMFTSAFELTWQLRRAARNPEIVMVNPTCMPVMAMKPEFAMRGEVFQELRIVLPDLFSEKSGRSPIPRARWKEIWSTEPSSVPQMERQIVKLVEQAFWALGVDPAFAVDDNPVSGKVQLMAGSMDADSVEFEDWMLDTSLVLPQSPGDSRKSKKKKLKGPAFQKPTLQQPSIEEMDDEDSEEIDHLEEETVGDTEDSGSRMMNEPWPSDEDDESVGLGVFNVGLADSLNACCSTDLTAASTEASTPALPNTRIKGSKLADVPSTPTRSTTMQPRQLVCYIWNQASQFPNSDDITRVAESPASNRGRSSAFDRGQWQNKDQSGSETPVAAAKAIVKNTFIDIEYPAEKEDVGSRARSLPPSIFHAHDYCEWHDHWHV